MDLTLAWDLSDTFNGLMAIPNLIGVVTLSGTVMKITHNYVQRNILHMNVKPMLSALEDIQELHEQELLEKALQKENSLNNYKKLELRHLRYALS